MMNCLFITLDDYEMQNESTKEQPTLLRLVSISKQNCFATPVIWLIITGTLANERQNTMLESRIQGQLVRPVWRALGGNVPQQ